MRNTTNDYYWTIQTSLTKFTWGEVRAVQERYLVPSRSNILVLMLLSIFEKQNMFESY